MDHTGRRNIKKPVGENLISPNLPQTQGADLHHMRKFNQLLILNYVRDHGPIARVSLAQRLGLSRTTVSSIVDILLQENVLVEGHFQEATPKGGRRAILVHFNADAGRVLGIDVGRSHLTMIITNLAPEIVTQRSVSFNTDLGPETCLPILISEIRTFVQASAVSWDAIIGIGLGIPGPLSNDQHSLISPPHMPGWDNVNIWETLRAVFNKPVYTDNDANMGALGEIRCGAGQGSTDIAYVKIGTGIGCGLVINGQVYRGHQGSAGELGHLSIDENGPICVCGNRGCLETLAAAQAIVADARQGLSLTSKQASKNMPSSHSTRPGEQLYTDITNVIQAAEQGEAGCIAALEHAGERLGLALAGLVNLFNPATIIIDGSVARAGDILLNPLKRTVASSSLPAAWKGTRIVIGKLGPTAIALGTTLAVLDEVFSVHTHSIPLTASGGDTEMHSLALSLSPFAPGKGRM